MATRGMVLDFTLNRRRVHFIANSAKLCKTGRHTCNYTHSQSIYHRIYTQLQYCGIIYTLYYYYNISFMECSISSFFSFTVAALVNIYFQIVDVLLFITCIPVHTKEEWFSGLHLSSKSPSNDVASLLTCLTCSEASERSEC